jgi:transcriptional regulator with XRE-family HTH domain
MYMTSSDPTTLAKTLENFRRDHGMTQAELARRLGVGQPHLSRVISGKAVPGTKLTFRARRLLFAGSAANETEEWLKGVAKAAARSPSFRRLVTSALEMLRRHGGK